MSAQETRYKVWEDYTGKFGVVKIDGTRYNKVVKVTRSSAVGYRAQISTDEWGKLPLTPENAVAAYVNDCGARVQSAIRYLEQSERILTAARLFQVQLLADNKTK